MSSNAAVLRGTAAEGSRSLYRKTSRPFDTLMKGLIWGAAIITVAVLIGILAYILINGIPHITWEFITSPYQQGTGEGATKGILAMIINTVYSVVITLLIATPIGIATAIYLTQYARQGRLVKVIRFTTETLAGIPSIIYGLFGYTVFVVMFGMGYSVLAGALTLTIMILPTIIRTTEESLKAVPASYQEGALALGAGKLRIVMGIVLPCAMPGVLTSVILAMGRIVGESAALIFTAGMGYEMPSGVFSHIMESSRTLTVHLYQTAMLGEPLQNSFATASILLIIIFILNRGAALAARAVKKG